MKVDGQRLLEAFRRHLHDHSLPVTQQRLAIAEAIFVSGGHLSAEEIAHRVSGGGRGVTVGTATVYRTLDLLVRSGLVKEHDFGDGFKRYEAGQAGGQGGQPHEHCICSSCGAVTEFSNDRLERMIALLAEEVEFRPHHHRLEIYGLCRSCQQSNPLARAR
jgi:Fur family ferric uptake transcriptional regulator